MPLLSSTVSFTRYITQDPLPDNFWTTATEQISAKAFRENQAGLQEMSTGWAPIKDPFKEEILLDDISFSDYLILSLRVDKRMVPAALLKKFCAQEEKRTISQRNLERLTAKMRKEIRERMKLELLSKALPVPSTHDMCWNIATGTVYFFCRQDRICGIFEDLFKATFGIRLHPLIPYTLGLRRAEEKEMGDLFHEMKQEVLA